MKITKTALDVRKLRLSLGLYIFVCFGLHGIFSMFFVDIFEVVDR